MITLKMTDGKAIYFNLKSWDREKSLKGMVCYCQSVKVPKKLIIRTTFEEKFEVRTDDIEECKFEEAEYVKAEKIGHVSEKRRR